MRIIPLLVGVYFGIVLVKSQVASWFRIQRMFRFEEAHMYLVLMSAIAVGAVVILIIRRFGVQTIDGDLAQLKEKGFHKGVIVGGMVFGMGWVITGACPGPIFAQIGNGEWAAFRSAGGSLSVCDSATPTSTLKPRASIPDRTPTSSILFRHGHSRLQTRRCSRLHQESR